MAHLVHVRCLWMKICLKVNITYMYITLIYVSFNNKTNNNNNKKNNNNKN